MSVVHVLKSGRLLGGVHLNNAYYACTLTRLKKMVAGKLNRLRPRIERALEYNACHQLTWN